MSQELVDASCQQEMDLVDAYWSTQLLLYMSRSYCLYFTKICEMGIFQLTSIFAFFPSIYFWVEYSSSQKKGDFFF